MDDFISVSFLKNKTMKLILILIILTALICCNNNVKKSVDKQDATTALVEDTCHPLSKTINYQAEFPSERTIDFPEGQNICRIVPDTSNGNIYVQKKIGADCWKTLDPVFIGCNQCGVELKDWNDDSFIDLYWSSKHYAEVTFYNPETQGFTSAIGVKKSEKYPLLNRVNYNLFGIYPHFDTTWSYLYRFESFEQNNYALLKVYDEELDSETKKIIKLYAVKGTKESLVQTWQSKEFPVFMKNNDSFDYFDANEFIKYYWTKNWKQFVPH
jgi:hypothetical protein